MCVSFIWQEFGTRLSQCARLSPHWEPRACAYAQVNRWRGVGMLLYDVNGDPTQGATTAKQKLTDDCTSSVIF